MSIFTRPDSPPPRQPSPEPLHTPLPSPPPRNRDRITPSRSYPSRVRAKAPMFPPGLSPFPEEKALLSVRSYEHMRGKENRQQDAVMDGESKRKRTRSALTPPPAETYFHSSLSSQPNPEFKRRHRRSLSFAIPYRSPPASPTLGSSPPPVPPIPAFALGPSSGIAKPVLCPQPLPVTPIYIPDLDQLSPISELPTTMPLPCREQKRTSPREKQRLASITCFKFFTLRSSSQSQRSPRTTAI